VIDINYFWKMSKYKDEELPLYHQGEQPVWTSASDIGKVFNGKMLTVSDYLRVEGVEKPFEVGVIEESLLKKGFSLDESNEYYIFSE
jgi:hypothetical protein